MKAQRFGSGYNRGVVTYNFDPDRWFEIQRLALDARRGRGELDEAGYQQALEQLEARYEEMTSRLDKPFDLPPASPRDKGGG